ncbi:MAG: o-succinylbenzoate synthase [Blastocatellia bacterium]|nr:MAG: o-succinylbenzoate synthase [Blastocatellia bacterium]
MEILVSTPLNIDQLIKVKSVALHRVRIPLIEPFRISNGTVVEKDSILIEVTTSDGTTGWGEASPMSGSFYSSDTPDSSWCALSEKLIPWLLEFCNVAPHQFYERLREIPGDAFAKAGLDGALWDAYVVEQRVSLCEALGIGRRSVPSGVAIGIYHTVDELLDRIRRYVLQGYRRVKIKIEPGWDIDIVAAVREQFPNVRLMVDANAAYTIADKPIFRELDRYGLTMIEQPFAADAFEEAGELQRNLKTALCADESADSLVSLQRLIKHNAARVINIKVQRVGGLSEALLMLDAARAADLECWVGTMPELGVASAQGLHLAMHSGFSFPTDIEASSRWYVDDVIDPLIEIDESGFIHVPSGVGSGFNVSREKVEKYSVARELFIA